MFETTSLAPGLTKSAQYGAIGQMLSGLFAGETDEIANAANMAALLYHNLPDLNWAGFYFLRQPDLLVLGPFQGQPACVRIPVGKGVCGTAIEQRRSMVVADVHAFPGHIACDAASRSELVVPLLKAGRPLGVFDLDSPRPGRFDDADRQGCEHLVSLYLDASPDL